jgi:hypothetical protein
MLQEPVKQINLEFPATQSIVQRNKVYFNEFARQVKHFLCGAPNPLLTRFSDVQQSADWWYLESISHRENDPRQP